MAKTLKPSGEQRALLHAMARPQDLIRTNGEHTQYTLRDTKQRVDTRTADSCIKYGWIEGNRDGLVNGFSQTYRLSPSGSRYAIL